MSILSLVRAHRASFSPPHRKAVWIAAVALTAVVASAHAQTALSLGDAQRIAVERSRQLAAQDSASLASREMAVAAGQLPDPVLKLGIDNLPVDGPDRFSLTRDFMTMRRIGVMQEITRGEKRELRRQALRARGRKSPRREERRRSPTSSATPRSPGSIAIISSAMARSSRRRRRKRSLEIEAAEARLPRRPRQPGRRLFARAQRASRSTTGSTELDRRTAQRAHDARALDRRRGRNGARGPTRRSTRCGSDVAYARARIVARHPEIAMLATQVEIAATEAQLAQRQQAGRLERRARVPASAAPAFSNMVSLGVSVPLQWDQKNRQDRELAAKARAGRAARRRSARTCCAPTSPKCAPCSTNGKTAASASRATSAIWCRWHETAREPRSPPTAAARRPHRGAGGAAQRDRRAHASAAARDGYGAALGAAQLSVARRCAWLASDEHATPKDKK